MCLLLMLAVVSMWNAFVDTVSVSFFWGSKNKFLVHFREQIERFPLRISLMSSWGGVLDLDTNPPTPSPQLLSLAFVQNSSSEMLSFMIIDRSGLNCSLPHTSLISPLDMLNGWKSVSFSRAGIFSILFALFPHGNLCIIITTWHYGSQLGACESLWSSSHVGSVSYCGLFVFTLRSLFCCPDMNWRSGRHKISLAVKINKGWDFKVYFSRPNVGEKPVVSLKWCLSKGKWLHVAVSSGSSWGSDLGFVADKR